MTISIFTLGCKTNYYESAQMAQLLTDSGHKVSLELVSADVFVVNTCAITAEAERKSRQAISRARRLNANCKVIVVGCASQHNQQQFCDIDNVTLVKGTEGKNSIVDIINNCGVDIESLPTVFSNGCNAMQTKSRAFVKIQDGCNNYCNYCIVPYLRGRSRSRSIESIVEEISSIDSSEIVLIGIDISQYGLDIGSSLEELLGCLTHVKSRIRLGSLEARVVTPEIVTALGNINFAPHLHLSLQSGCDKVLKSMNRHYTTAEFSQSLAILRSRFDNIAITCDIIVGFCGESAEEFQQTLQYVDMCNFADIHVFPYSPRQGTVSYGWADDVSPTDKKDRVKQMTKVKHDSIDRFLTSNIGSTTTVIAESCKNGWWQGYSANYITVYWQGDCQCGDMVQVRLIDKYKDGLQGEVV